MKCIDCIIIAAASSLNCNFQLGCYERPVVLAAFVYLFLFLFLVYQQLNIDITALPHASVSTR